MTNSKDSKGFTLIELLVVIAIVAILAAVVIITLNPAELLRQARDSNRISDLSTLKTAVSLYLADGGTALDGGLGYTKCYTYVAATANCGGRNAGLTLTTTASRAVNGTGWLPVNFAGIASGAPFGQLPTDPTNDTTYFYAYAATTSATGFEISADMESAKYKNGGGSDVEGTDGGSSLTIYEVGTSLSL